jgi:hypothetical protein
MSHETMCGFENKRTGNIQTEMAETLAEARKWYDDMKVLARGR